MLAGACRDSVALLLRGCTASPLSKEAVPETARIILLGDKDQLSAVEAGAVFSDLSADPTLSDDCRKDIASLCGVHAAQIVSPEAIRSSALRNTATSASPPIQASPGSQPTSTARGRHGRSPR